jgi:hypothetical protein
MAIRVSTFSWILITILFFGLAVVAYEFGYRIPRNNYIEEVNRYRTDAQNVVKTYSDSMNKVSKQHDDSVAVLNAAIQKQDVKIGGLTKRATKIEQENIRLVNEFRSAADSAPPVCDPVVSACVIALAGKDSLLYVKDSTIMEMKDKDSNRILELAEAQQSKLAQMQRADSLDRTIMNFPKPKRLFSIIQVTPTQSFLVGTTLGIILSIVIH